MIKKNRKLNQFIFLCTISILILIVNSVFTSQSNLGLIEHNNKINDEKFTNKSLDPLLNQLTDDAGGYFSSNTANFKTLENASSIINKRDYLANGSGYFNITTPQNWNISSMQFSIDPYSKKQIIEDPYFDSEYLSGYKYWNTEKLDSGNGYFTQYDLRFHPYGRTNIYNYKKRETPAFYQGDYAFWKHEFYNLNFNNSDIKKGKIIQEKDEEYMDFNNFDIDPNFFQDLDLVYISIHIHL